MLVCVNQPKREFRVNKLCQGRCIIILDEKKLTASVLVTIAILMVFSLLTVEHQKSTDIKKLKDDVALKAKPLSKNNQLESKQANADDLNRNFSEESATIGAVEAIAEPQLVKYSYKHHYRLHRRYWTNQPTVSRGSPRSINAESIIRETGAAYWPNPAQLDALVWISAHECTTPGRINPRGGYYGLFQLHSPPAWMVLGDAASETKAGCEYIRRRYGSPLAAKAWWVRHHWY